VKQFIISVLRSERYDLPKKAVYDLPKGTMYAMSAPCCGSVVDSFWQLEGLAFEDDHFHGSFMVYDVEFKKVVYRYGCVKE